MAKTFDNIQFVYERRLCKVGSRKKSEFGYFHRWEQYADVISPGMTVYDAHPGGQYARIFGIVEFANGEVRRVEPSHIQFMDEDAEYLRHMNEIFSDKLEKSDEKL